MRKTILFRLLFAFIVVATATISINEVQSKKKLPLSDLALENLEALASGEGGNTKDCPGGYCSRKNTAGEFCEACCPEGKDPECDTFSCRCY